MKTSLVTVCVLGAGESRISSHDWPVNFFCFVQFLAWLGLAWGHFVEDFGNEEMENLGARPKEKKKLGKSEVLKNVACEKSGDGRERNKLCQCKDDERNLRNFVQSNRQKIRPLLEQNYFFKVKNDPDNEEILSTIIGCSSKMKKDSDSGDMEYLDKEVRQWVQSGRHTCVLESLLAHALDNVQKESEKHTNEDMLRKLQELKIKKVDNIISPEARHLAETLGLKKTSKEEVKNVAATVRKSTWTMGPRKRAEFKQQPLEPAEFEKVSISDFLDLSDEEETMATQEKSQSEEAMEQEDESPAMMTKGDLLRETKGKKENELKRDSVAKQIFNKYKKVGCWIDFLHFDAYSVFIFQLPNISPSGNTLLKFTDKVRRTFNKGKKTDEEKEKIKKEPLSIDESHKTASFQDQIRKLEIELAQCKIDKQLVVEENRDMEAIIENLQKDLEKDTVRKRQKKVDETTPAPPNPVLPHRDFPGQRKKTRPKADWLSASRHARLMRTKDLNTSIQKFAGKLDKY